MTNNVTFTANRASGRLLVLLSVVFLAIYVLGPGIATANAQGNYILFDAPDAGSLTWAWDINEGNVVAGTYKDAGNISHGFIRTPDGKITEFDAPGTNTSVWAMNEHSEAVGSYSGSDSIAHGYLRDQNGKITTFDFPGNATASSPWALEGTMPANINSAGVIVGRYVGDDLVSHCFMRGPRGQVISCDVPGAGTGANQGTFPANIHGINAAGAITGYYLDNNGAALGFLRDPRGSLITFNAPNAGSGANQGTFPAAINAEGMIAGIYVDASGVNHGFLRDRRGRLTDLDDVLGAGQNLEMVDINADGTVLAWRPYYGILLYPDGTVGYLHVPGALFSIPYAMNNDGVVAGFYFDAKYASHSFVWLPTIQGVRSCRMLPEGRDDDD